MFLINKRVRTVIQNYLISQAKICSWSCQLVGPLRVCRGPADGGAAPRIPRPPGHPLRPHQRRIEGLRRQESVVSIPTVIFKS